MEGKCATRILEHLVGSELTFNLVDETNPDPDETEEMFAFLLGVEGTEGPLPDEVMCVRVQEDIPGATEYPYVRMIEPKIPTWRIAEVCGHGGHIYCTSWQVGVDPRTADSDGTFHHPDDEPVDLCMIHEL